MISPMKKRDGSVFDPKSNEVIDPISVYSFLSHQELLSCGEFFAVID